jgi:hypothetical protein
MRKIQYSLIVAMGLLTGLTSAQEFKTPVSQFQVKDQALVSIEASYAEIEIEEWNKNRVEVQGIMRVEGLSESEAKAIFDAWHIEVENSDNEVYIEAKSNHYGNDYFFIHNDKYMGNVVIDIPEITKHVMEALDSIHVVLPEITEFSDMDFDFDFNMDLDYESLNFDYEAFRENSEYLKEWQERNKAQLQKLKEELKKSQAEMAEKQKAMAKKRMIVMQDAENARMKSEKYAKEAEKKARVMEKEMQERQSEIQKILEKRQKIKVKRTLKVKLPKNAKLEMDVDYCKITTVN